MNNLRMTSKERCLATLKGEPVDHVPVFPLVMGFAANLAGYNYKDYASDGCKMANAQVMLTQKFDVDAITSCSDAFRISGDLAGQVVYHEMTPPHTANPVITCEKDLNNLGHLDVTQKDSRCADRILSVDEMVKAVGKTHLVLGWVDFPFAEACSCCGLENFIFMMIDTPTLAHRILEYLTPIVIDFALAQLEAGAPMIGCGDATASLLANEMFCEFALPYEKRVVDAIQQKGGLVKTHICGNTSKVMHSISLNNSDLFNIDHMVDLGEAINVYTGKGKAIKGNLDPVALLLQSTEKETYDAAKQCITMAKNHQYFLSAGCEIPTFTPAENLTAFCNAAKE